MLVADYKPVWSGISAFMKTEKEQCSRLFILWLLGICLILPLNACQPPYGDGRRDKGCRMCHSVELDPAHDIGCIECHQGELAGRTQSVAHQGLISDPAHPGHMRRVCGRCHEAQVAAAGASSHFTLSGELGTVWSAFFPSGQAVSSIENLPLPADPPVEPAGLVADLMRRRCLRCHVYYRGENYAFIRRGTGCAACHLSFTINGPSDHRFRKKVSDRHCLACHYGNYVGWDYYGRFEVDYDQDYHIPLGRAQGSERPYGLEWHEMRPDIHHTVGMSCCDCHSRGPCEQVTPGKTVIGCTDCHSAEKRDRLGPSGAWRKPPVMNTLVTGHRAHDVSRVDCVVCHAIWSFRDTGRALVRQDAPDYETWEYLSIQGSSEIEVVIKTWQRLPEYYWIVPRMQDKVSGAYSTGIWFEGFVQRRWGPVPVAEDRDGRLVVVRPVMDLSLSYVDSSGDVVFDNLRPVPEDTGYSAERRYRYPYWQPYHPHTIGKADLFRSLFTQMWLDGLVSADQFLENGEDLAAGN